MFLSIPTISISGLSAAAALASYLYQHRKYARSTIHKLGLETFSTYIWRGAGYRFVGYLRPRLAAQLSLRNFALNRLEASVSKINVPAPIPVELNLDDMFVPLTALSSQKDRVSAEQIAFGPYRNTILVGDPGSGKSTIVRKVYRDLCRIGIASQRDAQIPVLIELKDLDNLKLSVPSDASGADKSIFSVVQREVVSVKTYSGENLFEWFLDDGRLTVMLDGLDEVKSDAFEDVSREILTLRDQLMKRNPKNRLVVTTRRQLYVNLSTDFKNAFDTHLTLEPFTADDMYEFLRKWYYRRPLQRGDGDKQVSESRAATPEDHVSRIFSILAEQPNIRTMCATPLVLAMYVALDELTRGQNLPETRPEFYKAVTDELLVRRRSRQIGLTTGLGLLRRNRQRVLGRIALEHLLDETQSRNAVQWESAVNVIAEEEHLSIAEAEIRLRELSRDTGLFTEERREETLRFIHLTFCEFLAAQAIANGAVPRWTEITKRIGGSRSQLDKQRNIERFAEVIIFAAALENNETIRRRRIRWIVKTDYLDIALRAIVDSQPYDDEFVVAQMQLTADNVASVPEAKRDDQWIYLFRQMATTLRDHERVVAEVSGRSIDPTAPESLTSFIRKAIGDVSTGFERLFLAYIRVDASGALQMARSMDIDTVQQYPALVIGALDEPEVLAHGLAEFSRGDAHSREWAAVLAIAAMRHESLAIRLSGITYEKELLTRTLSDGRRRTGWHQCWPIRGTLLGLILEAGCRSPGSWRILRLLAHLPIRRNRWLDSMLEISLSGWLFLGVCCFWIFQLTEQLTGHGQKGILGPVITYSFCVLWLSFGVFAIIAFIRTDGAAASLVGKVEPIPGRLRRPLMAGLLFDQSTDGLRSGASSSAAMQRLADFSQDKIHVFKFMIQTHNFRAILNSCIAASNWSPNSKLHLFTKLKEVLIPEEAEHAESGREMGTIT